MNMTRRDAFKLAALAVPFESSCLSRKPQMRLLPSRAPIPRLFEAVLPLAAFDGV